MHWLVVPPDPLSLPPPSVHPELMGMTQIVSGLDDGASPHPNQGIVVVGAGGTAPGVEIKSACTTAKRAVDLCSPSRLCSLSGLVRQLSAGESHPGSFIWSADRGMFLHSGS